MTATVFPDRRTLYAESAARIEHLIETALELRREVAVCLTGGTTARQVYEALAARQRPAPRVAWNRVRFFWGDERDVPADHADSNYRMAAAAFLTHVPIDASRVHPIPADGRDAEAAARAYDVTLHQTVFASRTGHAFDLVLLGVGADAHIASLFPGVAELDHPLAWRVVAVPAVANRGTRISLTAATLLDAHRILVIASGRDKADAVDAAFSQPENIARWPAQILRRAGDRVEWLMDSAAAGGRARAGRPSR